MGDPARRGSDGTKALAAALTVVALFAVLVPWASFPVGFDVFRSLLIAWTWATSGFPATLPMAGHTGLDVHFADQQLGLDALLRAVAGADIGPGVVAPMLWGLVAVQALVLWRAIRLLRPDAEVWWILLLPLVSQAWMFRCTTLRAMLLAVPFLLLLVAATAARARGRGPHPCWLLLASGGFAYCHGAVELPPLLWGLGAVGTWLERGRGAWPWRDGLWVLGGLAIAACLRPDFPHNLWLWRVLNLGLLQAKLSGEVQLLPTELQGLPLGDLLGTEWTFLLAALLFGWLALRRPDGAPRRWSLVLPIALVVAAAFGSRRMLEMAAPLLLLGLAALAAARLRPWVALAGFAAACLVHAPLAHAGAEANRLPELRAVADWLGPRAKAGDVVFVTDWGPSSPLAWFTRDKALRFTGAIDPVYMWCADPEAFAAWQSVKLLSTDDLLQVVRQRFGARFLVFSIADAAPGAEPGTTANALRRALGVLSQRGEVFDWYHVYPDGSQDPRDWIAVDFAPR